MQKAYNRTYWENYPSDKTAVNDVNLNNIEVGVDEIDNRVITLDVTKFDKTEAAGLIKNFELDRATGIITITKYNGAVTTIDTLLEKIAVNFDFDKITQKLIIILDDGTEKEIDLSAFITQYEFLDSNTIGFTVDATGKVTAIVKESSIEEKHLRPNYLADIKTESAKAQASATAAATSETNAKTSETNAAASEESASVYAATATQKAADAAASADTAQANATAAAASKEAAAISETNAVNAAGSASQKATEAGNSAASASSSAETAAQQAANAENSADSAADSAAEAESYARGGTGTREGEDADNAKYYYEQAKRISQGGNGLVPMGTVSFAQLPTGNITANAMYNISEDFTSDDRFADGGGRLYGAGSNVYYTAEGLWDVLAASAVTGVKGSAETSYRQGNVDITKANIGLGNVDNTSDTDKSVKYAASAGSATSATALTTSAGSAERPVYFNSGKPVVCTLSFKALTQAEYNALSAKDSGTVYFITG